MPGSSNHDVDGNHLSKITKGIVGVYRNHYGKGPTKARTYAIEDLVVTTLEDFFTQVERTLVDRGKQDDVRDTRTRFQDVMEPEFTEVVERVLGRKVRAFMSQARADPEVAVEVFLLEPASE